MDSTHCRVHQHANGRGSMKDKAIGKSRGGLNTKIHIVVDALGKLAVPMELTVGNVSDVTVGPKLLLRESQGEFAGFLEGFRGRLYSGQKSYKQFFSVPIFLDNSELARIFKTSQHWVSGISHPMAAETNCHVFTI